MLMTQAVYSRSKPRRCELEVRSRSLRTAGYRTRCADPARELRKVVYRVITPGRRRFPAPDTRKDPGGEQPPAGASGCIAGGSTIPWRSRWANITALATYSAPKNRNHFLSLLTLASGVVGTTCREGNAVRAFFPTPKPSMKSCRRLL